MDIPLWTSTLEAQVYMGAASTYSRFGFLSHWMSSRPQVVQEALRVVASLRALWTSAFFSFLTRSFSLLYSR